MSNDIFVLERMLKDARGRCKNLSQSEALMGYKDTAKAYREMASEIMSSLTWVLQEIYRADTADLPTPFIPYMAISCSMILSSHSNSASG